MPDHAVSKTQDLPNLLSLDAGYLQFLTNSQAAALMNWLLVQHQQMEMVAVWRRSVDAVQREFMDRWICRFGGGAPLDG